MYLLRGAAGGIGIGIGSGGTGSIGSGTGSIGDGSGRHRRRDHAGLAHELTPGEPAALAGVGRCVLRGKRLCQGGTLRDGGMRGCYGKGPGLHHPGSVTSAPGSVTSTRWDS